MPLFRFGEFELDEQTLELRRKGAPVRIQQQPARVLAFLLNHRGTLVTREQIRLAIWGEDTFVDFEQGLNFCIRQIRLALNDQAESPSYVETLPRLGYRFVGCWRGCVVCPGRETTADRGCSRAGALRKGRRLFRGRIDRRYDFRAIAYRSGTAAGDFSSKAGERR
jgi:DNA-binding winged helix-turn-helix (wHTH) protein